MRGLWPITSIALSLPLIVAAGSSATENSPKPYSETGQPSGIVVLSNGSSPASASSGGVVMLPAAPHAVKESPGPVERPHPPVEAPRALAEPHHPAAIPESAKLVEPHGPVAATEPVKLVEPHHAVTAPESAKLVEPHRGPEALKPAFQRPKIAYPAEFQTESAMFLQHQLGLWNDTDARKFLGDPIRKRASYNKDDAVDGYIYAFSDPTRKYKEFELNFDGQTGKLRSVFVYPWKLTWQDCRRIWGDNVSSTEATRGRMFYSYLNRHLDVLVDRNGAVINLGLY